MFLEIPRSVSLEAQRSRGREVEKPGRLLFSQAADKKAEGYGTDAAALVDAAGMEKTEDFSGHAGEEIFNKGTSRRIWAELYKAQRDEKK